MEEDQSPSIRRAKSNVTRSWRPPWSGFFTPCKPAVFHEKHAQVPPKYVDRNLSQHYAVYSEGNDVVFIDRREIKNDGV